MSKYITCERKHDQSWDDQELKEEKNRNFFLLCTMKIDRTIFKIKSKDKIIRTWIIGSIGDFKSSRTSTKKLSNFASYESASIFFTHCVSLALIPKKRLNCPSVLQRSLIEPSSPAVCRVKSLDPTGLSTSPSDRAGRDETNDGYPQRLGLFRP